MTLFTLILMMVNPLEAQTIRPHTKGIKPQTYQSVPRKNQKPSLPNNNNQSLPKTDPTKMPKKSATSEVGKNRISVSHLAGSPDTLGRLRWGYRSSTSVPSVRTNNAEFDTLLNILFLAVSVGVTDRIDVGLIPLLYLGHNSLSAPNFNLDSKFNIFRTPNASIALGLFYSHRSFFSITGSKVVTRKSIGESFIASYRFADSDYFINFHFRIGQQSDGGAEDSSFQQDNLEPILEFGRFFNSRVAATLGTHYQKYSDTSVSNNYGIGGSVTWMREKKFFSLIQLGVHYNVYPNTIPWLSDFGIYKNGYQTVLGLEFN
jgi:hypothetical protein